MVGRRPLWCILNDLGDNVVQIRAIPVLRPDLRLGYIMLISVQSASFTLGQTSLSLSEMGGCIWDVFLFLHILLLSDSSCNEGHGFFKA